jgi:hypothetical protein
MSALVSSSDQQVSSTTAWTPSDDRKIEEIDRIEKLHLTCYAQSYEHNQSYRGVDEYSNRDARGSATRNPNSAAGKAQPRNRTVASHDPESVHSKMHATGRTVEQLDRLTMVVLRRYASIKSAAAAMQVRSEAIIECCLGSVEQAYGFAWRFAENESTGI